MTFKEALEYLKKGYEIKLPEWGGVWYMHDGNLLYEKGHLSADQGPVSIYRIAMYLDRTDFIALKVPSSIHSKTLTLTGIIDAPDLCFGREEGTAPRILLDTGDILPLGSMLSAAGFTNNDKVCIDIYKHVKEEGQK
jgi:hypothetical protein